MRDASPAPSAPIDAAELERNFRMNHPPYFHTGCEQHQFDVPNGFSRLMSRVVHRRRPSIRTFVVLAQCLALPLDRSNVRTFILPVLREEEIETELWTRDNEREDKRPYRNTKELCAAGFQFKGCETAHEFVVICPYCRDQRTTSGRLRHCTENELEIVPASWSRGEDDLRLACIEEEVAERLLVRLTAPAKL